MRVSTKIVGLLIAASEVPSVANFEFANGLSSAEQFVDVAISTGSTLVGAAVVLSSVEYGPGVIKGLRDGFHSASELPLPGTGENI